MLATQPLKLPCGLELPNRLAKAAMAETMAPSHDPDEKFLKAYGAWAEGGWGMILTGNVMVSNEYHGGPADTSVPTLHPGTHSDKAALRQTWRDWAAATQKDGTPGVVQLCHPGRQSAIGSGKRGFWEKTLSPSPIPLKLGDGLFAKAVSALVFGTPRELTVEDIEGKGGIIDQFVEGARVSFEAGFKGIELHAAHGYLLAQFMSQRLNLRTDAYGGSAAKRVDVILQIIKEIRAATSKEFCIGIKLNSADASIAGSIDDTLEQIRLIEEAGIDFIEVSGGTYEDPKMLAFAASSLNADGTRKNAREAFFLEFSSTVRKTFPDIILMVTGGFRTRKGMEAALRSRACDIIGLGRPAAILPRLPKDIIFNEKEVSDDDARLWLKPVPIPYLASLIPLKAVGAGIDSQYYSSHGIQALGKGEEPVDNRL